jgi:hypothetical protein
MAQIVSWKAKTMNCAMYLGGGTTKVECDSAMLFKAAFSVLVCGYYLLCSVGCITAVVSRHSQPPDALRIHVQIVSHEKAIAHIAGRAWTISMGRAHREDTTQWVDAEFWESGRHLFNFRAYVIDQ